MEPNITLPAWDVSSWDTNVNPWDRNVNPWDRNVTPWDRNVTPTWHLNGTWDRSAAVDSLDISLNASEQVQVLEGEELIDYIAEILGDSRLELKTLIPLTTIYLLFMVVGVLGNLATCLVILNNEYMRTATNVYLLNLAVADIATLIIMMPGELYLMWQQYPWPFGELACDIKIIVTEGVIYASILTIVAFTIERYLAICHPLSLGARSSTGKAKRVVGAVWAGSFLSAAPWAYFTKINYVQFNGQNLVESAWCSIPFHEKDSQASLYLMAASTVIYFIIPLVLVVVLYLRIGLTMKRSKMQRCAASCEGGDCKAERSLTQGLRTDVRMLVAVVVAFFTCWSPFHSQRLMFVSVTLYGEWTDQLRASQHVLFMCSGVFYYFNTILNPVLYSVMSKRFRRGFSDIRRGAWICNSQPKSAETRVKIDKPRHWIPKEQRDQILLRALGCNDRCDREVLSCSHSSSERHSSSRDEVKTKRSIRFQDKDRMTETQLTRSMMITTSKTETFPKHINDSIHSNQAHSEGRVSTTNIPQGQLSHWSTIQVHSSDF